jgi:hypothetical protein
VTNTLSEPGPYDPLDRTDPTEPVFPLVARDPHAPATVRHWVDLTRRTATSALLDLVPGSPEIERHKEKLRQCSEADIVAAEMELWRKGKPERAEAPVKVLYSGVTLDAGQLSEAQRKERVAEAVRDLREAAFHASEARDKLQALGVLEPSETVAIEEALERVNSVADAHTVRRAGVQDVLPLERVA